jgi:hypothetical protein
MPIALTGRAGIPDFSTISFRPSLGGTGRKKRAKPRYNTTMHPRNGKQECARRVRQISQASGWHTAPRPDILLVDNSGQRLHVNSHGRVVPFYPARRVQS